MNEVEFRELLARGHEIQGVEFKAPGSRKNKRLLAQVVRAALGMSNRRYGGTIVIGIDEDSDGFPMLKGLSTSELESWAYDDLASSISTYADPSVSFESYKYTFEGKEFLILDVEEFDDIPVLCKRSYDDVLREGACYVRSRRKPETSEIPSQADMRDLLDLATEKRLRKFVATTRSVGIAEVSDSLESDDERFAKEIDDFLGESK
jgi:predicted HTH transcriptional regulator